MDATTNEEEITRNQGEKNLLENEELQDVQLQGTDGVLVGASRAVLASRSKVFHKLLLGNFKESSSPVVPVGYQGAVLQALVEYVVCDTAKILEKKKKAKRKPKSSSMTKQMEKASTLVSLCGAANYFQLYKLETQAANSVCEMIQQNQVLAPAILQMCEDEGPCVPAFVSAFAMRSMRSEQFAKMVGADRCKLDPILFSQMSLDVMKEILADRLMEWTDFELFKMIMGWVDGAASNNKNDRMAVAKEELTNFIRWEGIAPSKISLFVASSGLLSCDDLLVVYKNQALAMEGQLSFEFDLPRHRPCPVWSSSGSDFATADFSEKKLVLHDVIVDSPSIIKGEYCRWTIRLHELNYDKNLWLGIKSAVEEDTVETSCLLNEDAFWGIDLDYNVIVEGEDELEPSLDFGEDIPFLDVNMSVTMELDLRDTEPLYNGTLYVSVDDSEMCLVADDLLSFVEDHPMGFQPAAILPEGAQVELVEILFDEEEATFA